MWLYTVDDGVPPTSVQEYFAAHAGQYETDDLKPGSEFKLRHITEHTEEEQILLDVGCGDGRFTQAAADIATVDKVIGIDISSAMLSTGEYSGMWKAVADAQMLPFDTNSIDIIHMDTVLHHLVGETRSESKKCTLRALSEAIRVVSDDGLILITERHQKSRFFPDRIHNEIIFWGLKFGSSIFKHIDPRVHNSQPPISFYTDNEFEDMVGSVEGTIIGFDDYHDRGLPPLQQTLQSECVRRSWAITPTNRSPDKR